MSLSGVTSAGQAAAFHANRTVHLSEQAVELLGEARSDPHRMDFRDRDGRPPIRSSTPEETFEAWKECSRGRPCDFFLPFHFGNWDSLTDRRPRRTS